jgi:methylated-DNA-[protein]-cysteine S-methyltransferase
MAILGKNRAVEQLVFGHSTRARAVAALDEGMVRQARHAPLSPSAALVRRLQAYAEGEPEDFRDVQVDLGGLSGFRRRVFEACRQIPYGQTLSYAELAVRAGFPKAFRAVGNCLAANRVPLIIPCHRVVCSNGQIGRFSAPGGGGMKQRLIQLEAPNWPRIG